MGSLEILHGISCLLMIQPSSPSSVIPSRKGLCSSIRPKSHCKRCLTPTSAATTRRTPISGYSKEWEREFDAYVQYGNLPNLQLVRFAHDHFGDFTSAIDGVNTPDKQMADNDYAVGLLVEKVAKSPYKDSTLIFVIEDDAQDGGDHVDAHRSVAYIVGPYVKREAVVSRAYNTVSMIHTIEDVLGLEPLGLTDGLTAPMAEVFEETLRPWTYTALVPEVLRTTELPLPPRMASNSLPLTDFVLELAKPRHDAAYWQQAMGWQNFKAEDKLDPKRFNEALWHGLMGQGTPYPEWRHGHDRSRDRELLLQTYRQSVLRSSTTRAEDNTAQ